MIQTIILECVAIVLLYMTAFFVAAQRLKNNTIVDIAWGLGFVVIGLYTFFRAPDVYTRKILVTTLIFVWGIRLALYIFFRSRGKGEDARYAAFREKWGKRAAVKSFFFIFMFQGVLMLIIASSIIRVNTSFPAPLTWLDIAGLVLFGVGFCFEVTADWQMNRFKSNPENRGKLMTSGMYKYSRHPNYFGEVTLWWGIFLLALPTQYGWATLVSPLIITLLILFFSGIPLLEKRFESRPGFADYKAQTPKFFPFPPRQKPS